MSDPRSPEQKAADDALKAAILEVWRVREQNADDTSEAPRVEMDGTEIVKSFVVVAHIDSMTLMERGSSGYAYITTDSGQGHLADPPHVIRGLLDMGQEWFS